MSSSINLNLDIDGVGDKIAVAVAAAVAEAMSKQQSTIQSQNTTLIGEEISRQVGKEIKRVGQEVSEQVAAALDKLTLEKAALDLEKPTFDVRQQIVANFILACFHSASQEVKAITVVVASHGEHIVAFANFVGITREAVVTLLRGPAATSDTEALQGLYDVSKRALARALELHASPEGFQLSDMNKFITSKNFVSR